MGYAIVALSLVLIVQAKNVYPQLLLGRLLFSLGGAAVSTMVTAVLPTVTQDTTSEQDERPHAASTSSNSAPPLHSSNGRSGGEQEPGSKSTSDGAPSSRLAGFVGTCAGCGALFSLVVFLPLPARLEKMGVSAPRAIQYSYYFVAGVALVISAWCFLGLRNLSSEKGKGWRSLFSDSRRADTGSPEAVEDRRAWPVGKGVALLYWRQFSTAISLGFHSRDICLGYLGGFVARSSSVGISLFIPLSVNHFYRTSGLCGNGTEDSPDSSPGDIKHSCPQAYILASILTGVSQLIALCVAHAFGFLSVKPRRFHLPLLFAALAGVVGYIWFALLPDPRYNGETGNASVFIVMALIGISQIGAIVCSLAVLSNGILTTNSTIANETSVEGHANGSGGAAEIQPFVDNSNGPNDRQPLLGGSSLQIQDETTQQVSHLKGSIAGVYSLYGGAGILLLTKMGGLLFDTVSPRIPFYVMAAFNGILLLSGIACGLVRRNVKASDETA